MFCTGSDRGASVWLTGEAGVCAELLELLRDAGCEARLLKDASTGAAFTGLGVGGQLLVACGEVHLSGIPGALLETFANGVGGEGASLLLLRRSRHERTHLRIAVISPVLGVRRISLAISALAGELAAAAHLDSGAAFRRRVSAVLHRVERLTALSRSVSEVGGRAAAGASTAILCQGGPPPVPRKHPVSGEFEPDLDLELGEISGVFGQGSAARQLPNRAYEPLDVECLSVPPPAPEREDSMQDWAFGNLAELLEPELDGVGEAWDPGQEETTQPAGFGYATAVVRTERHHCGADARQERPTIPVPPLCAPDEEFAFTELEEEFTPSGPAPAGPAPAGPAPAGPAPAGPAPATRAQGVPAANGVCSSRGSAT